MFDGATWVYIWFIVGIIWALYVIIVERSEVCREKATAILCSSLLPFIIMMCAKRGGISVIDLFAMIYLVIKLKKSLMEIWEYYDPSPW